MLTRGRAPGALLALLLALAGGCEPVDEMAPALVAALPDGDARGSAASGTFRISASTQACAGACQHYSPLAGPSKYCEVGVQKLLAEVVQTDGHLALSGSPLHEGLRISSLAGGIDADGTIDVGGTRKIGDLVATMRVKGVIRDRYLTASATLRGRRKLEGDCTGTVHWSGEREGQR